MAEKQSLLQRLWANQHGRQYQISAIASGASTLVFVLSGYQLLFMNGNPNYADWQDMTGLAIGLLVISGILMMVSIPTFFMFKGYVATLNEIMTVEGRPELKRRISEAEQAAKALGAGHLEKWTHFAQENKLYRK
jgi:uncharacterized membrane protein